MWGNSPRFRDRKQAGRELAGALSYLKGEGVVVFALPRGGIPIGAEITEALGASLDVIGVAKLGHPLNPEYAIGAVAEGGFVLLNPVEAGVLDEEWMAHAIGKAALSAEEMARILRDGREPLDPAGKTAILVDDGAATGFTLRVALQAMRAKQPTRLIVAVPVGPPETLRLLSSEADKVVSLMAPEDGFGAVGSYYEDFAPIATDAARATMARSRNG